MVAVLAWLSTFYLASWGNGFNTHYGTFLRAEDSLPADMVALMDPESNPCDNFYKYACGTFDEGKLKGDQLEFAYAWDGVSRNNTQRLQPLIAESPANVGIFYRSCMNLTAIEQVGTAPLLPFVKQVEDVKDLVSLTAVIYWWHKANVVVLYDWSVESDPHEPDTSALYLMQGGITMPAPEFYTSEKQSMKLKREGFKRVARNVLVEVCKMVDKCDVTTWPAKAATSALEVETELARRFASAEQQRTERSKAYTISEIEKLAPSLHLKRFINAMAGTYHSQGDTIANNIKISIRNSQYFEALGQYVSEVNMEDMKAYLLFRLAFVLGADMDAHMEDMGFMLQRVITGQVNKAPRWKKCMHSAINALPDDVGKIFVENFYSLQTKQEAEHMLLRLKLAFHEDLGSVGWLEEATKRAAQAKLKAMFFAVGRPSHWNSDHGLSLSPTKFLWNGLQLSEWYIHHSFQRLTGETNKKRWGSTSPTMTDAFYSYTANGLFVPAGILQPPFFSTAYSDARNYGALGAVLGHEITHGFDDQGRKFGADGQMHDWWGHDDVAAFERKANCIVDFYGGQTLEGEPVNGKLTLGENIADMGGVKLAYTALKGKAAAGSAKGLTPADERLFFTSWGQNWCVIQRRRAEVLQLMTDEHAPNFLRVNGPLANFPPFAKAFQCDAGERMAPARRCELW